MLEGSSTLVSEPFRVSFSAPLCLLEGVNSIFAVRRVSVSETVVKLMADGQERGLAWSRRMPNGHHAYS